MINVFDMSDEEFAKLGTATLEDQAAPPATEEPVKEEPVEEPLTEEPVDEEPPADDEEPEDDAGEPIDEDDEGEEGEEPPVDPVPAQTAQKPFGEEPTEDPPKDKGVEDPAGETVNFEEAYKQIMAPFKANGKMIQAESVEEVIRLMQMGANYTKKMMELQPRRKLLVMLEQNNLLDAEKLSFLIDLDKKDPQAIQKFLKDAKIDPLDIDTDAEPSYQEGRHVVSDQEALVLEHVRELQSLPSGEELLASIRSETWDQGSRRMVFNSPGILHDLHAHYQQGAYQLVADEVERLRTLGHIGFDTPFLLAYKQVGEAMEARGAFGGNAQTQAPATQTRTPVATRTKRPSSPPADNQRVRAAAPPRSTTKTAQSEINLLAMSDEEFLKLRNKV